MKSAVKEKNTYYFASGEACPKEHEKLYRQGMKEYASKGCSFMILYSTVEKQAIIAPYCASIDVVIPQICKLLKLEFIGCVIVWR